MNTMQLSPACTLKNYQPYANKNPCSIDVERLLRNLGISREDSGCRHVTWLDLYVLVRARGHPKPIPNPTRLREGLGGLA